MGFTIYLCNMTVIIRWASQKNEQSEAEEEYY